MVFSAEYGLKTRQVASWIWKRRGVLNKKMVAVRQCDHKKAPICLYSYVEGIEYIDSMASSMCCHRVYIRRLQIHKLLTKLTKTIA